MYGLDELLISSSLDPHEVVVVKGESILRVVLIELVSNHLPSSITKSLKNLRKCGHIFAIKPARDARAVDI